MYLYIYMAPLEVHTNQKRFQCERPRQKRAALEEQKEALGSPANKVDCVKGGSWFQNVNDQEHSNLRHAYTECLF